MGRFGPLHRPDHDDVVISPMDCVGPRAFLDLLAYRDNVHPNGEFLSSLALTILSIQKMYQCDQLPGAKGLLPPGLSFSSLLEANRGGGHLEVPSLMTNISP